MFGVPVLQLVYLIKGIKACIFFFTRTKLEPATFRFEIEYDAHCANGGVSFTLRSDRACLKTDCQFAFPHNTKIPSCYQFLWVVRAWIHANWQSVFKQTLSYLGANEWMNPERMTQCALCWISNLKIAGLRPVLGPKNKKVKGIRAQRYYSLFKSNQRYYSMFEVLELVISLLQALIPLIYPRKVFPRYNTLAPKTKRTLFVHITYQQQT